MPDVKVMYNLVKNFPHMAGNGYVPVWYEGGDEKAITN